MWPRTTKLSDQLLRIYLQYKVHARVCYIFPIPQRTWVPTAPEQVQKTFQGHIRSIYTVFVDAFGLL